MKCNKCDAELPNTAKFCANCGIPTHTAKLEAVDKTESEKPKPSGTRNVLLVLIGIALVGTYAAMFIGASAGRAPGTNTPYLLSVVFGTSVVFYLWWKQKGRKGWEGALLGAIIGFLVYVGAVRMAASNKSTLTDKAGAEQLVDMLEDLYDKTRKVNQDGSPALIDKTFAPSEDATGYMGELQQFFADIANQIASMDNDYLAAFDSIGWDEILDEDHLLSDPTFKKSWQKIVEARLIVDNYEIRTTEVKNDARDKIQDLNLSEKEKREMEDDFMHAFEKSVDSREKLLNLVRLQIDEIEKAINLLAKDPQTWRIEGDQFIFERDAQVVQFKEYMANIARFYVEQSEIEDLRMQKLRESIEELKKL